MKRRQATVGVVGLSAAATALTGALVVTATNAAEARHGAAETTTVPESPPPAPCFGSADAAEHWIRAGAAPSCLGDRAERRTPSAADAGPTCVTTADTAQHWIRATGHLPCDR